MDINEKHIWIIENLKEKDISSEKLAFEINVTEKTLANYVSNINNYFQGSCKVYRTNNKYTLLIKSEVFYEQYVDFINFHRNYKNNVYERKQEIIYQLLENETTLNELSEVLYISTTTLNQEIKNLRLEISAFNLEIIGKPNVGIKLIGEEFNIRRLLIEKYPNIYDSNDLPKSVAYSIEKIKNNLNLDADSYRKIRIATCVVLNRLSRNYSLNHNMEFENVIIQSHDYREIDEIKSYIKIHYPEKDSNKEVLPIVMQLMGRRASFIDEIINDEDERLIKRIIKATIKDVEDLYQICIDESLFTKDIQLHIKHLINRLLFEVTIESGEPIEIVNRFPFAYELSKILGDKVYEYIGIKPSIEELGYVAIYFSVYLEKLEQAFDEYKKIAIVTDKGLSIQKLLTNNIRHLLGEELSIDIVNDIDIEKLTHSYDLIISTIESDVEYENFIYLDKFYDFNLLKFKIEKFLIFMEYNSKDNMTKKVLTNTLLESDFIKLNETVNYKNAYEELLNSISFEKNMRLDLMNQLNHRESKKSTVFGKMAFPHTTYSKERLIIKIGILENNLKEYPNLKLLILLIVPKCYDNEKKLIKLYEEILSIASNKYLLKKVNQSMDFEEFMSLLKQEMGD